MSANSRTTIDGNEAVASVAYRMNEVIGIYPITPASPMGEHADEWAVRGRANLWGQTPDVVQMQSEAGAAGAVHGALQAGTLATTFTASQGLLLMIPNMYKIAGELTSFCMHVAARTLATHALSIFGDHSDVMACRQIGFSMLCSANVQEAHDLACIGQAAALRSRVPVLHFFDGFRTSHEVAKIRELSDDELRRMVDESLVAAHRARALTPDRPMIRGTAQNPDTFFQAREACNGFYDDCPGIVDDAMQRFAEQTGRRYGLFEYVGHREAERVIVVMGSACDTVHETVEHLVAQGEKVGLVKVRLFRPFSLDHFLAALPATTASIAVLDRTKEPGALGEPLYQDVLTAVLETSDRAHFAAPPRVVGGRYGLSSKEFTPGMVKGVFDHLSQNKPLNHFTVGINDDLTHRSIAYDAEYDVEPAESIRAVFYGLGSDGTVGANKNAIKIIGDNTDLNVQGYFVYDSKKAGARTISHLRFGPKPIRSPYLIQRANFVACHQFNFLDKYDVVDYAMPGGVFLLNSPFPPQRVWDELPRKTQQTIIDRKLRLFVINANALAAKVGLGGRINTIMQVCFFKLSKVIDLELAIEQIKDSIRKTYGRKGDEIVNRNLAAVDGALDELHEVETPAQATAAERVKPIVPDDAPQLVKRVTAMMMADKGDLLPVSAFPPDGSWPVGTTQWEKRNIAAAIPIWEQDLCIQCNKCAFVCPHAAIRAQAYDASELDGAPETFKSADYKAPDLKGLKYTIQVAPEDCTGCELCVMVCPAKDKSNPSRKAINMAPHEEHVGVERDNYEHFLSIPPVDPARIGRLDVKGSQFLPPLFEYSGACAGCGETPYVKLLSQLFGDRLLVANATGCSSIYGGNLPTTPWTCNAEGRGPAWANSLFEDNAEFGLGFRLAVDYQMHWAAELVKQVASQVGDQLVDELLAGQHKTDELTQQRRRIAALRDKLKSVDTPAARALEKVADYLAPKSVWLVGGDGWAYDIGYGGLDHVMSQHRKVNILVMDTEVYSNTGGQASKATPLGASAKFAIAGKPTHKKDLGLMAMSYGHVYVASVAFGANDNHTVKTFLEAESYPGPSLIIAYSHCVAHGYNLRFGTQQQKRAVDCGVWPLYRYDPRNAEQGQPALHLDTGSVKGSVAEYMSNEARFRFVEKLDPQRFKMLARMAKEATETRVQMYRQLAELQVSGAGGNGDGKGNGNGHGGT